MSTLRRIYSVEEAQDVVRSLKDDDYPLLILGGGSNLLLTGDYAGTVLHSGISFIEDLGNGRMALWLWICMG